MAGIASCDTALHGQASFSLDKLLKPISERLVCITKKMKVKESHLALRPVAWTFPHTALTPHYVGLVLFAEDKLLSSH